ncbi:MAG: PQQ-binding-like beta-propeller repeat protein [Vicinamibacterales bacterium]
MGTALAWTAPGDAQGNAAPNDSFRPRARHLVYVALPGTLELPGWANGVGVVALDADDNYRFVKRIPVWEYAASMSPEQVSGVAASPVTNYLYVAARGRLAAIDMGTDKVVWSVTLDGKCCERPQVTPDGTIVVVGGDLQNYWYEVDAKTGALIGKLDAPASRNSHNLNLSGDGKTAFMSPNNKVMTISDVLTRQVIKTIAFPDNIRVFVLNKDSTTIYSNTNNLLGYVIADVASGKVIKTVEVTSVDWKSIWNSASRPRIPHACPSHGIALTPDEKEVWVADGIFKKIHVFSNTEDPKEIHTIDAPAGPYWIMFGLDGKYAFASSGEVIEVATHKVLATLKDEYGRPMYSEKMLDITFINGHAQRVSNQFANAFGDYVTAEKLGVGPHVTPMPGSAPLTLTDTAIPK